MINYPPAAWNDTAAEFDTAATLPSLLRACAQRYPDRPAVADASGVRFTHAELDVWSDRMAGLMTNQGVGPGDFVGLLSGRSSLAVASLVSVLKTGAAYVPLDPDWPSARVELLLSDLDVRLIIAGTEQQREALRLAATVESVRGVICPESDKWSAATALDDESVTELFDYIVEDEDRLRAAGFNARGTVDYTLADLATYRSTLAKLAGSDGSAVLEIGCGSGELVAELGPSASRYVAMDISPVSVQKTLRLYGGATLNLSGVAGPADRAAELTTGLFDLVLMSSVVQFFPDTEYLLHTLDAVAGLLRPGGRVLLGDLIDPAAEDHAGLALSRSAYLDLGTTLPSVTEVTVHERHGTGLPAALATRFDVELTVGRPHVRRRRTLWTKADIEVRPPEPVAIVIRPDDVAYAISTSGSTGRPKCVVVHHRAVVNLIEWLQSTYAVGPDDRLLFVTSFSFDLSVFDMFGVLASGGFLRVADAEELAEPDVLIDLLVAEQVTIWDSAPAVLEMIAPFFELRDDLADAALRLVLLSGDWIPLGLPGAVRGAFGDVDVVAMGGATECTVWSNHFLANEVDPAWPSIPYGKPIANARYYILDDELQVLPVGTAGDLYISGECVALGYVGAPELTASKFLPDPWSDGSRMYRTGDRARWLENGLVEFLGRLDDQVKIRGYRVELGEVQSVLRQAPGVRTAVVLAVSGPGGKTLCGFYVADEEHSAESAIRRFLGTQLPAYMIPERLTSVDAMPLTGTGKIDRAALSDSVARGSTL